MSWYGATKKSASLNKFGISSFSTLFIRKSNKKSYRLGDEVKIKVVRASKEDKEIDFELV